MKLLIKIISPTAQICEEALALAFAMVAFEHHVQLWLAEDCVPLLLEKKGKFGKMLSALDMYEIPPAWLATDKDFLEKIDKALANFPELEKQLISLPKKVDLTKFDTILTF